ncbi:hypothetical protein HDV05_004586 [Chytridiales sp. JEL 0842]|nr:hypothetical protein HDV05_004586 [Chytridiales sp. JEL 0842]
MNSSKRKIEWESESSDESEIWEEVADDVGGGMSHASSSADISNTATPVPESDSFQITIPARNQGGSSKPDRKKVKGIKKHDRLLRQIVHKVHILCLLSSGLMRNQWCNDPALQGLALSLLPNEVVMGLTNLNPQSKNAKHAFNHYLKLMAKRWKETFPTSPNPKVILNGPSAVQESLETHLNVKDEELEDGCTISPNVSVLAFVAACRALGLKTRLVGSLHPIPLSMAVSALHPCYREPTVGDDDFLADESAAIELWGEVFSELDGNWIPICPLKGVTGADKMEPAAGSADQQQLSYVISFEDGGVKDVTRRYSSQWSGRTVKLRLSGEDNEEWLRVCLWLLSFSGRTNRDKMEESMLISQQLSETMPTKLDGFKQHALYALERHCSKNQVIHPKGKEYAVGNFKGEHVYPRKNVKEVLSAEAWKKKGRSIKAGEEPLKTVRPTKRKKGEAPPEDEDEPVTGTKSYGLFGEWQTEDYRPEPLVDGKIPKNNFGNFELFHENMLPPGCVHLTIDGIAAIARKLGIDYAKAMTGFEYHRGNATPVIKGIVILKENEEILKEAWQEDRRNAAIVHDKEKAKRAVSRWRKLVDKLLTRQMLLEKYT